MKRGLLVFALLCLLSVLSGCGGSQPQESVPTLPPAISGFEAPYGREQLTEAREVSLYLPGKDGVYLYPVRKELWTDEQGNIAGPAVRALLEQEENELVFSAGKGVRLELYGKDPVEVSGAVCTVNLSSSALQLEREVFYQACQAITETLCGLDGISYVNVLVAGQAVGMDITGNLVMGSLTSGKGSELTKLWEQIDSRRADVGQDPSKIPVTAVATLYFPMSDGESIMPETRTLNFSGQTPQQLAEGLLNALSAGPQYLENTATVTDIASLLLFHPIVSEMEDGGRLITLIFDDDLEERMKGTGSGLPALVSSVTYTLTTFIPGIAAMNFRVGDSLLMSLETDSHGRLFFQGGIQRRNQFSQFLADQSTLYFSTGDRLAPVSRVFARGEAKNPETLIVSLMEGPTEPERRRGLDKVMPEGLDYSDVLGMSVENDTVLLNLSERCREKIRNEAGEYEQLLCYSLVNTLCESLGTRRACFFFDGETEEHLCGIVYWGGEFLYNPAMTDHSIG